MAENTLQFQWIVTVKENLEFQFVDRADVFVAGDLLWYPVKGKPKIRQAPDAMVVFGRPKGYRGSYRQWAEGGISPQVVWEILSPGNRPLQMTRKRKFYERHGVEEYYVYDPDFNILNGWIRKGNKLVRIADLNGWISPRLGIRFELTEPQLTILGPTGARFITALEMNQERQRAEQGRQQAEQDRQQTEQDRQQAEREKNDALRLARQQAEELARLREQVNLLSKRTEK